MSEVYTGTQQVIAYIGEPVYVFEPGKEPIEAKIAKIDEATGLILEVFITDPKLENKVMQVKSKVVVAIPTIIKLIKNWKSLTFRAVLGFIMDLIAAYWKSR